MRPPANPSPQSPDRRRWELLLAILVATALGGLWAGGQVPIRGDAGAYFTPLRLRVAAAVAAGSAWDPLQDLGASLWSNPQSQLFYLPGLLGAILDPLGSSGPLAVAHVVLFALGLSALLRERGHAAPEAALGALTAALSSVLLSLVPMQDKLHSLAWLPWLLWGVQRSLGARRGGALPVALSLAAAVVAGGVDLLIVFAPLGALQLREAWRGGGLRARRLVGLAAALGFGLALSGAAWVPLVSTLAHGAFAGGADGPGALARPLLPGDLLALVAPNLGARPSTGEYFLPWEAQNRAVWLWGGYLGGAALIAGVAGLTRGGARAAGLLVACYALALGPLLPPVAWVLSEVPPLSSVRYAQKWMLAGLVPAALLVAHGGAALRAAPRRSVRGLLPAGAAAVGLALLVGAQGADGELGRALWRAGQALAAGGAVGLLWRGGGARRGALALALVALDLAVHGLPLLPTVDPVEFWRPPPVVQALRGIGEAPRLWSWSYEASARDPVVPPEAPLHEVERDNLHSGYAAAYGFPMPYGWMSLHPRGLEEYFAAARRRSPVERVEALRMAGVTHLLVHFRDEAEGLARLPSVRPLGVVRGAWNATSVFEVLSPLPSCRWTPADAPQVQGSPIEVQADLGSSLELVVPGGQRGRVVCLRPWSPGWTAWDGARPLSTEPALGYQLSVVVAAGPARSVRLEHRTPGLLPGLVLSLLGLLGLLAYGRAERSISQVSPTQ